MFSKFFIDRPIFSMVLSIVVVIAGLVSMRALPIEEYPKVTPPQVMVMASYPGASADTISKSVAAPLEQQINGVDGMIYMTSTSSSSGLLMLSVSFAIGTDPDQATINVNNRVQQALNMLPKEVQSRGVTVAKRSTTILKLVALTSKNGTHDSTYMANYALINVIDELKRLDGVGDAGLFGRMNYSMRIWLIPDALSKHGLTPLDVATAVQEQNNQFAAGKFNQTPTPDSSEAFTYTVTTQGRLTTTDEFENIILKVNPDGSALRLRDVAEIELGSEIYDINAKMSGAAIVPIGVYLQSGANALVVSKLVDEAMERVSKNFPEDLNYLVPYDTTDFIRLSINEVYWTFFEAMVLVIAIIYLFLQSFRATIIPLIAVPVSIIGTFAGMYLLGFSINLLTLFGLILAIGIVVDDAIIVIENVERILRSDKRITVKEATYKAMQEVTSPIVAIVLVLCAVFIPVTFMGGFTGQMYQQFAITIVISVCISGMVALTLTPALCATYLSRDHNEPFWFVKKFNEFFDFSTKVFANGVMLVMKHSIISIVIMIAIIAATIKLFYTVPPGLVPSEDKGVLLVATWLPSAATLDRTDKVRDTIGQMVSSNENVKMATGISGFDITQATLKTNGAVSFVVLEDWEKRKNRNQSSFALANQFTMQLNMMIPEATSYVISPPPIMGLSMGGGFEMYIQDRTGGTTEALGNIVNAVVDAARQRNELNPFQIRSNFDDKVPQYVLNVDREKAKSLGISIVDAYSTLQATLGSYYINDFNLFGRTYQVNMQAKDTYRSEPSVLKNLMVKSRTTGELIPISSIADVKRSVGPDILERYNVFPSVKITGDPAPGYTSGDALRAIEEVANQMLPEGYNIGWIGTSYQEKKMSNSGREAIAFAVIFIFLILAAQYERWLMPLAVITAVPFAAFGAILAIWLRRMAGNEAMTIDLYFLVGLLVLVGLSAKNAILIVEFSMSLHEKGKSILDASIEAAKLRFRPIVMTSLAFTLGVVPLALSSGAGSASRHSIGTGVIGGMIAATTISIFFVPLFYSWLATLGSKYKQRKEEKEEKIMHKVSNYE